MTDRDKALKAQSIDLLYDMVAKNNLVCFTGAGISRKLRLQNGKTAPDWRELLSEIAKQIHDSLSDDEIAVLDELLSKDVPSEITEIENKVRPDLNDDEFKLLQKMMEPYPSGDLLIEAASFLYKKDKATFKSALKESVTLVDGETSKVHKLLLKLTPKGIITYNYDLAHENAIELEEEMTRKSETWETILPKARDENKITGVINGSIQKPFLFKAHGSIIESELMILTTESYRELLSKNPIYKAFMQYIFTNYQLLFVGFGLSDPDFDMMMQELFSNYGSPIQKHVVFKHSSEKTPKDLLFTRRYGLHFIYVDDFNEIPLILSQCTSTCGPYLKSVLDRCLDLDDSEKRGSAHRDIKQLSDAGNKILAAAIKEKIEYCLLHEDDADYLSKGGKNQNTLNSEYVFTYGVIANCLHDDEYTRYLVDIVNRSKYSEPVAHALIHLRDLLNNDYKDTVNKWIERFKKTEEYNFKLDEENKDPDNRLLTYSYSIKHFIKAKYPDSPKKA